MNELRRHRLSRTPAPRVRVATAGLALFSIFLSLLILPPGTFPFLNVSEAAWTTVVISEFRVRGPNGAADEFVEIYNLSPSPVNISGWKISGSNSGGTTTTRATVGSGVTLGAGCYYLITNSSLSGGPYSGSVSGNLT